MKVFFLLLISCTAIAQKPNVLFITVDDMNAWGVKKGYPLTKTPYLDKLKTQAYNFVNNVCASPVCAPSRAAFFSGIYPHRTGAYYNGGKFYTANSVLSKTEMMPECFKRNGYETFGAGKIFHENIGKEREAAMFDNHPVPHGNMGPFGGTETWVGGNQVLSVKAWEGPDTDFPDVVHANAAIDFLQKPHDKPFFCYVGFMRPHTPYTAPKRFFDLFNEQEVIQHPGYKPNDLDDVPPMGRDLVDSLWRYGARENGLAFAHNVLKRMNYGYLATTAFADWSAGRVIEALDKTAYAENTIVIVASDNGFHLGPKERWQKGTMWELSAYAPLLIRLPNGKAYECTQPTSLIDLYPTLVELCSLNPPAHLLNGKSLIPVFKNPNSKWNPSLMTYGEGYASITDGRYRYIRYPDGSEELYDHQKDPHEWDNIAKEVSSKKIIKRLSKTVPKTWAKSLGGATEKSKGS